jgi:D-alanyl-lipoteichoic acid acyltransferase DltB (MBOAT superfamily)
MTFNSLSYFLFLPVVYLVFYFTADCWRWLVLLTASYGFYATFKAPYLLAILLMVTGISYTCGLCIAAQQDEAIRKRWLWIGIFVCVAILVLLKYLPFLESHTNRIFGLNNAISVTIIIIGVSYFTFQAISYMADIYLEIEEPEHHFGRFALYMAFFPKLLQGPIERAGDLLPQLKQPYQFNYDAMRSGMLLFTWGLFKKVVVADRLALYADQVYNHVHDYTGLSLIIGTYAYALQIYFDFSAYTDMARGTGRMFGINLTENFNSPYLATSIADFWRRWHISFSRWILDYIFKPLQLGWRNWGQAGTALALIITFLVSGIWHGATWGFVVWGLLHGIYLATSTYYRPYQKLLHKWLRIDKSKWLKWWQVFVTFNLVCVAFIFFRAKTLNDAIYVVLHMFIGIYSYIQKMLVGIVGLEIANVRGLLRQLLIDQPQSEFITLIFFLLVLCVTSQLKKRIYIYDTPIWYRWSAYYLLFIFISFFGTFNSITKFVYLQF